jgi:FkbH-like protein
MTVTVDHDPREVLATPSMPLARTMKAVEDLEKSELAKEAAIGIASNATVDLLGVFLRKHALLAGVKLRVQQGNHDDVLGDIDSFSRANIDSVILLPFFDNLLPAFEAQAGHLPADVIADKISEVRARYRLAFEKAKGFRQVFLGTFHRMGATADSSTDRVVETIVRFNQALREEAGPFPNVRLIDMGEVVSTVGHANAFDRRFYFRGKAPYSTALLDELARRLAAASRAFGTHFYKVLVFDCDNTIWGGVIGEDLLGGIKLSPYDYPGNIFWRVQQELVSLERAGVLLVMCSKNNPADVDEVFSKHPDVVLTDRDIILKRVNWSDKSSNLREIASSLNIGLDSLVFLDDSEFECSGVRSQLPMVRTFQVPKALPDYPLVIEEIKDLFLAGGVSQESRSKTAQYRQRSEAESLKASFGSNEEFLASLELKLEVSRNASDSVPRISELTMKSNQFNVTTRRYTAGEISKLMAATDATVYSIVVRDRFGSAGLTGVIIMRWLGATAVVDSFLMSCRVIGRGIEFGVWNEVLKDARLRGCTTLSAQYLPTSKNSLVADFFDRLGLSIAESAAGARRYETAIDQLPAQQTPWIEVISDQ